MVWLPFVTQTEPNAAVTSSGVPPTSTLAMTWFDAGSMRTSCPSQNVTTQTDPKANAKPCGVVPTGIVAVVAFVAGLIRVTVSVDVAHASPKPNPIPE